MVKFNEAHRPSMDRVFSALADPTRRAIVERLAQGDTTVNELAAPFRTDMSLPAVSKHLRVLERAGLLRQEKDGRIRRCHLDCKPLKQAHDWVARYRAFWSNQLDALAGFLEQDIDPPKPKPGV